MEGPPKKQGTFHVLKCNHLKINHLQNAPWKVSVHRPAVPSYSPQSEAEKVLMGALGTLGKKVKPVSFSRSAIDMSSLADGFWPLRSFTCERTKATHLSSEAEQSLTLLPLLPLLVRRRA